MAYPRTTPPGKAASFKGEIMAIRRQAIQALRPRLRLQKVLSTEELVQFIVAKGNYTREQVLAVLSLLTRKVNQAARLGSVAEIPGLGTFWPPGSGAGGEDLAFEADPSIIQALNAPGVMDAITLNPENIGLTQDELVEKWNALHPNDLVED